MSSGRPSPFRSATAISAPWFSQANQSNGDPRTPSRGHLAGRVHRPAHAVVRLVHPGRIIDLKDDELELPVVIQISEGATRAVVLPGKPVWNGNEVGRHW